MIRNSRSMWCLIATGRGRRGGSANLGVQGYLSRSVEHISYKEVGAMKPCVAICILCLSALLGACATASLPLAATAGADPGAAKHNAEGIEHYNLGHWDIAKTHFEAAIKSDPKLAEAHYNLALTLDKLGAHADATGHFKKAVELAPGNTLITDSGAYRSHVHPRRDYDRGYGYGGYGGMY